MIELKAVRNWIHTSFTAGAVPFTNYSLVENHYIFRLFYWGIRDFLAVLLPVENLVWVYTLMYVIQMYLSGIFFLLFGKHRKFFDRALLTGSLIYVFGSFYTFYLMKQPVYAHTLVLVPLCLLGIEKILEKKNGLFFSLMIGITALCCITFIYPVTLILAIYILFRIYETRENSETLLETVKLYVRSVIRIIIWWGLGIALSGIVLFPVVSGIRSSSRMEMTISTDSLLWYHIENYKSFAAGFLEPAVKNTWGNYFAIPVFLPAIMVVLAIGKLDRKTRAAYHMLILSLVLYLIPLWGLIAKGFANISNYWMFGLVFFAAYAGSAAFSFLARVNSGKLIVLEIFFVLNIFYLIHYEFTHPEFAGYSIFILILAMLFFMALNSKWLEEYTVVKERLLLASVCINICFNMGILSFPFSESFLDTALPLENYYAQFPDSAASEITDTGFYRVDKYNYQGEFNLNLPQWYDYPGMSVFHSVLMKEPCDYYVATENRGFIMNNKISDLDGRAMALAPASVKYYLVPSGENHDPPFGFEQSAQGAGDHNNMNIYVNTTMLPVAYTYPGDAVSTDALEGLNGLQIQELMLQHPIMDNGAESVNRAETTSAEIAYQIHPSENARIENGQIYIEKNNGSVRLRFDHPDNSEVYVRLSGLTPSSKNVIYTVECKTTDKTVISYKKGDFHKIERNSCLMNLGYQKDPGSMECTVSFSQKGVYDLKNIQVLYQPMDLMDSYIEELQKESLTDITIGSNRIEGMIDASEDKWMCFSLPYSAGWRVYVDGAEVPTKKMNYMYLGIWLEEGRHHIAAKYSVPGLRAGAVCSGTGIFICLFLWLRSNRRKHGIYSAQDQYVKGIKTITAGIRRRIGSAG